jgi:hypothetical protein
MKSRKFKLPPYIYCGVDIVDEAMAAILAAGASPS